MRCPPKPQCPPDQTESVVPTRRYPACDSPRLSQGGRLFSRQSAPLRLRLPRRGARAAHQHARSSRADIPMQRPCPKHRVDSRFRDDTHAPVHRWLQVCANHEQEERRRREAHQTCVPKSQSDRHSAASACPPIAMRQQTGCRLQLSQRPPIRPGAAGRRFRC